MAFTTGDNRHYILYLDGNKVRPAKTVLTLLLTARSKKGLKKVMAQTRSTPICGLSSFEHQGE